MIVAGCFAVGSVALVLLLVALVHIMARAVIVLEPAAKQVAESISAAVLFLASPFTPLDRMIVAWLIVCGRLCRNLCC